MRYDDDYDYNSRSSRNGSRRSSSSRSSGRDYDRDYYDRDYRSDYGRSYDYNRGYSDRNRYSDRYDTRSSRDFYDDFDRSDWERTAPDWEEHGNRKKRSSSSSSPARRSGSSSSRSGRSSDRSRDRERDKRRSALQFLPVIIGLVVIILAALVIRNMLSGNSDYSIQVSSNIVLGETATATLVGRDNAPLSESTQVEWSSRDNNVISVSGDGPTATLTAESLGNATIVASINGETVATQTVTAVETAVGVAAIRVSQEEITIPSGESYTINATVEMEEEYQDSPATIQWSSNNTSVATVSEDGVITARQVGNAIIKGVAGTQTVEISVEVVENTSTDNSTHDATQDVGQEPEDGTQTDTGDTGTGTGTGDSTGTGDTGTGSGTGGSTDTGTGSGGSTDTGDTGTGSGTGGSTDTGTGTDGTGGTGGTTSTTG